MPESHLAERLVLHHRHSAAFFIFFSFSLCDFQTSIHSLPFSVDDRRATPLFCRWEALEQPLRPPSPSSPNAEQLCYKQGLCLQGRRWLERQVAGSAEEKGNTKMAQRTVWGTWRCRAYQYFRGHHWTLPALGTRHGQVGRPLLPLIYHQTNQTFNTRSTLSYGQKQPLIRSPCIFWVGGGCCRKSC